MTDLEIKVSDTIKAREDVWYITHGAKKTGGKEVLGQGKVGMEMHSDTNTWQYRYRHFDFQNRHKDGSYIEKIINKTLNIFIEKKERLVDHIDHGSGRKKLNP